MAYVQIPKDLSNVKTKVALNLTKRQLIGFAVAGLIGIPTYLKTRNALGNDLAIFLMMILTILISLWSFMRRMDFHVRSILNMYIFIRNISLKLGLVRKGL